MADTNQGGGTLYPFKSYLNALSWTMDGTYKLYPSKYILLSGTQESIVSVCDGNFDSSNSEVVEEYAKQRLLPFCFKDGNIQYVTTTDSDGNEVKTLDPQIEKPNNSDDKYIQQKLGYVGDIVCGGDINFLNHDSGQFETIIHVSQADQQACTYLTKFSLDEPDISDTIFVDATGVENPNYPDKISFDGVLIFYNVYRKVGEFVDDLTDVYMADLPMAIYKLDTGVSLGSDQEWLTRICMTFDSNSKNSLEITTISDNGVVVVANKLNDLITLAEEIDAQDAQYYTDLDEVRSYYNEFKNNRHVNVPYIQGNWWFVNGKKAGLYQMGDIIEASIDEMESDLEALEKWLGYNENSGAFPEGSDPSSLYSWIESISKSLTDVNENMATDEDLTKLETWLGYDENSNAFSAGCKYSNLYKWVDAIDLRVLDFETNIIGLSVVSDDKYIVVDPTNDRPSDGIYHLSLDVTKLEEAIAGDYLLVDVARSTYLTIVDAEDKYKITPNTHSDWQMLTLYRSNDQNILDFIPGHLSQTYITASSVADQDLTYVYDENNPCYGNIIYAECDYGISPLPGDEIHDPNYGNNDDEVRYVYANDREGNKSNTCLRNCISSQLSIRCSNELYSSYNNDDTMMRHTQYHCNSGTGLMLLNRDNTFKDYIPRAYVCVHSDLIDFLVDTHTEKNDAGNVHPNVDWDRYTGDDKDEIKSYSKRVWLDRAGFHMGTTLFNWSEGGSNSGYFYIGNNNINFAICAGEVPETLWYGSDGTKNREIENISAKDGIYCKYPSGSGYKRMLTTDDLYTIDNEAKYSGTVSIDFSCSRIITGSIENTTTLHFTSDNKVEGSIVHIILESNGSHTVNLTSSNVINTIFTDGNTSFNLESGQYLELNALYDGKTIYVRSGT